MASARPVSPDCISTWEACARSIPFYVEPTSNSLAEACAMRGNVKGNCEGTRKNSHLNV
jgi:hypothetical protein